MFDIENSSDDSEFQEGIALLKEIKEYDHLLTPKNLPFLRDLSLRLKQYRRLTENQKNALKQILQEVKKKSDSHIATFTVRTLNPSLEHSRCHSTGSLHATHKETGNQYVFRCDCDIARFKDFAWPEWNEQYNNEYKLL